MGFQSVLRPGTPEFRAHVRSLARSRIDVALEDMPSGAAVDVLCDKLSSQVGNPDLAEVIAGIKRIYHASPSIAHYEAAHRLRNETRDVLWDELPDN